MKKLLIVYFVISTSVNANININQKNDRNLSNQSKDYIKQTPPDNIKALELFKKSCAEDNESGCFNAGIILFEDKKYVDARSFLKKAYELNNIDSAFYLGELYYFGNGVKKDLDKAIEYYEIVSAQPNHKLSAESDYSIANAYIERNVPNYKEAINAYKSSCLKKYKNACHDLGYYYQDWKSDGTKDYLEAKKWYEKAHELGSREASYSLGIMYLHGKGVKKNIDESISYFLDSEKLGFAKAAYNLGSIYVQRDNYKKAQYFFEKALSLGLKENVMETQNALSVIYLFQDPQFNKKDIAISYLTENINNKHFGLAAFSMGVYFMGIKEFNEKPKPVQSLKYFYISEELKEPRATKIIKRIINNMTHEQISEARRQADEYMKQLNAKDTP